ncbi:signal peptidase II [Candidatus Berkiella aquae]|uniref:Lipoprotein signal peptidase n=1 Tax=Candidatus Berkiella aquae TaxID=295108 RepID=A0A0Q9YNE3_9GAMM|nr:signal peptidase II [Candidatus Berkiella aquae]MCS5712500.1 lipoprotein signal peptidase [Candidatus Berkiella aquae]
MLKTDAINITAKNSVYPWFGLSGLLLLLDQLSKWWVVNHIAFGEFVSLIPSFSLTLTYNTGIAFSLFSQQAALGKWLLISFTLFISTIIAIWLAQTPREQKWNRLALAMILGGALGNICDRIFYGHVIDFIDFYFKNWHWYTFNLADCFITIGAVMTIFSLIFSKETQS